MIDQNKLDGLFLKAKKAPHTSVFSETKEQFLIASSDTVDKKSSKKDRYKPFNKGIIMLTIAGVIALTCFLISSDIEENTMQNTAETTIKLEKEIVKEKALTKDKNEIQNSPIETNQWREVTEMSGFMSTFIPDLIKREVIPFDFVPKKKGLIPFKADRNDDYVFPKLTDKEISDNNRRKKKMLKALNKKDNKIYSYIPAGTFTYESKSVSVAAFHMQKTEVTNLEYKTFLFDLLIQDRKADFLIAKPKQELWTEELGEDYRYMQDDYFSGEDYEEFPVNNISRKGAQMYCYWITHEANEINKANGKPFINDVRIPMRVEWVKAATVEGKFPEYPWKDDISLSFFLCNFSLEGFVIPTATNKKTGKIYTIGHEGAITSAGRLRGKDQIMSRSESYEKNEYGLYNMCGNVAEMVYELNASNEQVVRTELKGGTAGGGWMNTSEEIKLNGQDLYQGVEDEHLNIGFRVVITHWSPFK